MASVCRLRLRVGRGTSADFLRLPVSRSATLQRMNTAPVPAQPGFRRVVAAVLALLCLTAASSSWGQWQWRDESGRRHFSDRPPPAGVPEKDILQRPRGMAAPASMPADTPGTAAPARSGAPAVAENPLEQRKQQLDQAEAEKRKAEEKASQDKAAQVRAANCATAQRSKAALDSGVRLTVTNARGEAEYLDEAGRAAQLRQANELIRDNCR